MARLGAWRGENASGLVGLLLFVNEGVDMRYFDEDEAKELNAEPWQLALLQANPGYCSWGPNEDYMWVKGDGWNSPQTFASWAKFGPWELDELNECANFYFEVTRASEDCKTCGGNGYHPHAQWVSESFYSHSSPFKHKTAQERMAEQVMAQFGSSPREILGHGAYPSQAVLSVHGADFEAFCEQMRVRGNWNNDITQDEVQALVDAGRLKDMTHTFDPVNRWQPKTPGYVPTAAEVNEMENGRGFGHDAINRSILIEARLKRFGMPKNCPTCDGNGYVHTEPSAHVSLVLWWLHPRKGCSRGLKISNIQQADLPKIRGYLASAAERNAQRFAGIGKIG